MGGSVNRMPMPIAAVKPLLRPLVRPLLTPNNPLGLVWMYRTALWRTTINEVRQRYAGSTMGLFWLALAPGLLLALYGCVFVFIYKTQPAGMDTTAYLLQLF